MTSLTDIEKRALSTFTYGERLSPTRDWLLLLAVAAILLLASVAMNVVVYESVKSAAEHAAVTASVPEVDATAISNVEAVFKERAAQMQNYERVYEFVDPSR